MSKNGEFLGTFFFGVLCMGIYAHFAYAYVREESAKLRLEAKRGIISNTIIIPEKRLTTDGKTVDTLYIYKKK